MIASLSVGGGELGHLAPIVRTALVTLEHVCGAGLAGRIILRKGADDGRVAAGSHADAEEIACFSVGGQEFLHLAPVVRAALVTLEDVGGPGADAA